MKKYGKSDQSNSLSETTETLDITTTTKKSLSLMILRC